MTKGKSDCDLVILIGIVIVFALPLTLLVPDFSIWHVIPKIRVTRYHAFSYKMTWPVLNATLIAALTILFCLYLEIRKRRLDDMVLTVLAANEATGATMAVERERQANAVKACVQLLDVSAEHYENLALLRDDLRKRQKEPNLQVPPAIESSGCWSSNPKSL